VPNHPGEIRFPNTRPRVSASGMPEISIGGVNPAPLTGVRIETAASATSGNARTASRADLWPQLLLQQDLAVNQIFTTG
jgi:hypothetical protein